MPHPFIRASFTPVVLLPIAFLLAAALPLLVVPAQAGSVVTVNADKALVLNGRKVFTIGFSPGPPTNGRTSTADDAMQELRDAGGDPGH
ncbi:MAG: hypothetical protein DME25_01100 [Verrucomicrobia bacterium]|nr:MAG: hypothetical protein DME25_01100 [Verrucomicrobiota bacterium]